MKEREIGRQEGGRGTWEIFSKMEYDKLAMFFFHSSHEKKKLSKETTNRKKRKE